MTITFPNISNFDLEDINLIAGNDLTITFALVDNTGNAVNISSANSLDWYLSNFGSGSAVLHLSGSYIASGSSHNSFSVFVSGSSTINLPNDKYVHQYQVVDFQNKVYRPSQGIINLSKAIQ